MLLLHKTELVPAPLAAAAPTPLVRIDVGRAHLRALTAESGCAAADAGAAGCAGIGVASLPEDKTEAPAAAHAGAGDGRGAEVRLGGHLGRAEGRAGGQRG